VQYLFSTQWPATAVAESRISGDVSSTRPRIYGFCPTGLIQMGLAFCDIHDVEGHQCVEVVTSTGCSPKPFQEIGILE
jgi:hypothetical protein